MNIMKKRYIIFLLLFIGAIIVFHEKTFAATPLDSLKFEYLCDLSRTKPGDKARLEIYNKLSRIVKDTQTELYYIDRMLREAQAQKNNEYVCKAYLSRLVLAYNTYDVDEVNRWYRLLEQVARKEQLYEMMFRGRRGVIDMLNVSGDYEEEEKESLKMLEEARELKSDLGMMLAYQCLSHAYRATFRQKEAAEILEKAYDIAYHLKDISIVEINNLLIGTYQTLNDQPNILKWTKKMDAYLQNEISENPALKVELKGWILLTYIAYLTYYTEEKDLDRAADYLKLAEEYKMTGYAIYENYYHLARYRYFFTAKMYNEALVEIDFIIELYRELAPGSFGFMNFQKANLLERMERTDEALALYQRAFYIIDSVQVVTLNKQTELLKKDYDTDQLLLKKELIQGNIQSLFLFLVIVIIVILLCFVAHAYRVRTGLRKSEEEMRRMAEEMEQANVAKEVFLSTISTSISVPLNSVVSGSLKLASEEVLDVNERKLISENLNKTSAELLELINNILNLSRLEAGMMKFNPEVIEIIPFVQGIAALLQSKGKKVDVSLPEIDQENSELKVYADIARLQEIFNNVLVGEEILKIRIQILKESSSLQIDVLGTELVCSEPSQETTIANEVNRMVMEYFGGQYTVLVAEDESQVPAMVRMKFPIKIPTHSSLSSQTNIRVG